MTLHELGYRPWNGKLHGRWDRWYVIAANGTRLAWRNPWLRRLLVLAWLPTVYLGVGFFLYEQSVDHSLIARRMLILAIQSFPEAAAIVPDLRQDPAMIRHAFWSMLLLVFLRYLQGTLMVLVVGMFAPSLITQDLRTRAYLLYFSHELTSWEYLLGKAMVIFTYLSLITLLPATGLYILAVMLSPNLSVLYVTWDLPLRVGAATLVLMIPAASLALMFSSLTVERRYAGFGWFALWIVGWVAHLTLRRVTGGGDWWWVSVKHTIGKVQAWIFGVEDFDRAAPALILLAAYSAFALVLARARILTPLRS